MKTDIKNIRKNSFIENYFKKLIKYNGEIINKKDYITKLNPSKRIIFIDFYAEKKINLTYKKLKKPKITYCLEYGNNYILEVPYLIYEHFKNIKEDLSILKNSLKPTKKDLILYNKFKNKLNEKSNILNENEKEILLKTDLYLKKEFKKILRVLK